MKKDVKSLIGSIEELVKGGKAVVSAESSIVISLMQEALKIGRTATFFVSPEQGGAVMRWYWTPNRIKEFGMEPISKEERAKIESELGVPGPGGISNRIQCTCGAVYGEFEFMEQGIEEHGKDWVKGILELKDVSVVRINPAQDAICRQCHLNLIQIHNYSMYSDPPYNRFIYGCCRSESSGPILA